MANVNQIRLQQISGSLATIDSGVSGVNSAGALPAALGENTIADMEDIMTYFAQAIANIHGKTNFGTQTPGLISFDASGIDIVLDQDQSGRKIHLDSEGSVDIDAITGLDINVATGGSDARDLAISSTGGGDSSVLISSAGSGADALSLDVSAGSMVVAPSLADGQTLKLGKNGAVEMVFTPHGTPANEKVSLTNTAGTADDAISLVATAGGVKVQAGDDSLHLDADGTDADALNIDSAGGMDVDVAGVLNMAAGDDSVIAVTTAAKDLALTVSGGGAQVLQLNSAGTGTDAIDINASAGGIDIDSAAELNLASSAAAFLSGSSFVGIKSTSSAEIHATSTLTMSGTNGLKIQSSGGSIQFESHDADSAMNGGFISLATSGEFAAFVAKDLFSSTTTIMGAINALAQSGEPTKVVYRVTGSHAATTDLYLNTDGSSISALAAGSSLGAPGTGISKVSGTSTSLAANRDPHKVEVFLNGMLLMSGSSADVTNSHADYRIAAANRLQFGFALAAGDVLQVMDRS